MLRCIVQELRKNFYYPYVLLSVVSILALCLSATGKEDESRNAVMVISMMLQGREAAAGDIQQSALFLWAQGLGSWLPLFLPLILTFGYMVLISEERRNGQVMFQLLRGGNIRYTVSKVVSGALYGGIVFAAAYALYGGLLAIFFPSFSAFPMEEQSYYLESCFNNNITFYIIRQMAGIFLYGMSAASFGIGAAIFFRDKYMLLSLPFLMNYIYRQVLMKFIIIRTMEGRSIRWLEAFFPDSIMQVSPDRYWLASLCFLLAVYAGLVIAFYISVKRGRWGE